MNMNIHIKKATIRIAADAGGLALAGGQEIFRSLGELEGLASIALSNVPKVGDPWPEESGFYAGIMPAEEGQPAYHLIIPTDPAAEAEKLTFGGYGKDIAGLSKRDGLANTKLLLASGHEHPAAKFCAGVKIGLHEDFYLMSQREAALAHATVPHLFKKGWHWTSSQYAAYNAFVQAFSDGYQGNSDKGGEWRVCAVRRKLIH